MTPDERRAKEAKLQALRNQVHQIRLGCARVEQRAFQIEEEKIKPLIMELYAPPQPEVQQEAPC